MADSPQHTGGMLALVPDNAGALALTGGEPAEALHLTLLYLGDDVTTWPAGAGDRLRQLVTASAPSLDPVDARIIGPALFNPDGGPDGDRTPCLVLMVGDAPGLGALRTWASWTTSTYDDYPDPPAQHEPYLPHITLGYGDVTSYGYGDATGDGRSSAAGDGGTDRGGSSAATKRLPDLGIEPGSAEGGSVYPEWGARSPGSGDPSDRSRSTGETYYPDGGRSPLVSDETVRGSDAPPGEASSGSFDRPRARAVEDALLGSSEAVRPQGVSRLGSLRAVSAGGVGALEETQPRQGARPPDSGAAEARERGIGALQGSSEVKEARADGIGRLTALTSQLAQLAYTGPVRFSTLRLALAGDVLDMPLGNQEAPVITETKSGEITFTPPQVVCEVAALLPGPIATIVAEGKALNARGVEWVAENCGTVGVAWAGDMRDRAGEIEEKRAMSGHEVNGLRRTGHTLDGRTNRHPVQNSEDLKDQIDRFHDARPGDKHKLKAHLRSEAHRLYAPQVIHDRIDALNPDHDGDDDSGEPDKPGEKALDADGVEYKRDISMDKRHELRKAGHTLSSDSTAYPVEHLGDLDAAIQSWGRANPSDRSQLKRHLKSEAHRLKAPQSVHDRIDDLDSGEKSLEDDVEVKIASPDPRAAKLRNFWAYNPKGRAKWRPGSSGDFKRLRRHLAKYVHSPRILNGLTANIHKMATGEWPGKYAHTARGNVGRAMNMGRRVGAKALVWPEDVEIKAVVMAIDDTDAELAALHAGVDDWGQIFDEPYVADYLAALEESLGDAPIDDAEPDDSTADLLATAQHAAIGARMIADDGAGSELTEAPEGEMAGPSLFDAPVTG